MMGVRLTGTLGVLLKAKQEGRIEAIRPLLDLLHSLRFRLSPATRRATLELAGEAES